MLDNGVKTGLIQPGHPTIITPPATASARNKPNGTTSWFGVKTADVVERYVSKGRLIAVEGKLEYRQFEDAEGRKHYFTEIRANDLLLLDRK